MHLYRFVIGIQFNRRTFRLPSVGGVAIDEILKESETEKVLGPEYFTQVSTPTTKDNQYSISLINDDKSHSLAILPDQFLFKKTSGIDSKAAVNVESAIEEFQKLWKIANSTLSFPETRRIGFVGEYRLETTDKSKSGIKLMEKLTTLAPPSSCGKFHLSYEDRELSSAGERPDKDTDDFWNYIYSYYLSEMDETPVSGKIHANIDVQKYYNPAKRDPIKELKTIKDRYLSKKTEFKTNLKEMGLVKDEK